MEYEILKYLAGAGDIGIYLLVYIIYKFDRRLFVLENQLAELYRNLPKRANDTGRQI